MDMLLSATRRPSTSAGWTTGVVKAVSLIFVTEPMRVMRLSVSLGLHERSGGHRSVAKCRRHPRERCVRRRVAPSHGATASQDQHPGGRRPHVSVAGAGGLGGGGGGGAGWGWGGRGGVIPIPKPKLERLPRV